MADTIRSAALVPVTPVFNNTERLALAGRLTRRACELDLRQHPGASRIICGCSLPAAHVRGPRLDYESHGAGLDRNALGALLVATGLPSTCRSRCQH